MFGCLKYLVTLAVVSVPCPGSWQVTDAPREWEKTIESPQLLEVRAERSPAGFSPMHHPWKHLGSMGMGR